MGTGCVRLERYGLPSADLAKLCVLPDAALRPLRHSKSDPVPPIIVIAGPVPAIYLSRQWTTWTSWVVTMGAGCDERANRLVRNAAAGAGG